MFHLISGTEIEPSLAFHSAPQKKLRPKFKKYLQSNTLENYLDRNSSDKMLDNAYPRYS